MKLSNKRLKVYHFAQVPCKAFEFEVKDEIEAYRFIEILAMQHLFLESQRIIPDYSNAIGVEMWSEDTGEGKPGWEDYYNDEEFMDWDEFAETYLSEFKPIIISKPRK